MTSPNPSSHAWKSIEELNPQQAALYRMLHNPVRVKCSCGWSGVVTNDETPTCPNSSANPNLGLIKTIAAMPVRSADKSTTIKVGSLSGGRISAELMIAHPIIGAAHYSALYDWYVTIRRSDECMFADVANLTAAFACGDANCEQAIHAISTLPRTEKHVGPAFLSREGRLMVKGANADELRLKIERTLATHALMINREHLLAEVTALRAMWNSSGAVPETHRHG